VADPDDEGILYADGFEEALLGTGRRPGQKPIAVYDRWRCIQILMERDGMDDETATEFFEFNVAGAWVGDQTPLFLETL
jgi:hypothetical protein